MSKRDELVLKVLSQLDGTMPRNQLSEIGHILSECFNDYEIEQRNTGIIPFENVVPEWYIYFIVKKKMSGKADGTLKLYNRQIVEFFHHIPVPIEEMTSTMMVAYLYDYQKRHGVCERTLDSVRVMLHTFVDWAVMEGYVKKNFVKNVDPIKYVAKPRKPLTEDEVTRLRNACNTYREKAIVDTFLYTGVRVSELANIEWSDIDLNQKTIQIFGKGKKYRTVLFNSQTKQSILQYKLVKHGDDSHLFVSERSPYKKIGSRGIENIIKGIVERSGLTTEVSPHTLRHTFATHALANGMPIEEVSALLGHESLDTTTIYAKIQMASLMRNYDRAFA